MKFAVMGGDMRQAKLAELLAADGYEVSAFALDKLRLEGARVETCAVACASGADCVILPLPVTAGERMLNAPFSDAAHDVDAVLGALRASQLVCAGRLDEHTDCEARARGLTVVDYFAREELAVGNAVATAEGAVQLLLEETPITLCGAECLVIGYGRIGKILSHRLRCMGARVTVAARRYSDAAWIRAFGCAAVETGALSGGLGVFDVVVNTVPACVLNESRLRELKRDCFCLDLASKPGGFDFQAASRLGVHAVWALGLPGETAPASAGAMIRDVIYNILREQGRLNV